MNTAIRVILGLFLIYMVWLLIHWLLAMVFGMLHMIILLAIVGLFVYVLYQVFRAANRQRL